MIIQKVPAAATAVVGYDMLTNEQNKNVGYDRVLTGAGLCGSAAGGDSEVEIYIGNEKVANLFNTTTGLPTKDHLWPMAKLVPANTPIQVKVVDAAATNPLNLVLTLDP